MTFSKLAKYLVAVMSKILHFQLCQTPHQYCKGCKYLKYNENGGHWCILFAENCSVKHQPLSNYCYDGGDN